MNMDESKVTVLVIGGCGGLGSHIVQQCLENSFRVAVLDIRTTANRVESADVHYFEGSLTSRETVQKIVAETKATVIVNTASPRYINQKEDRQVFDEVNINGTQNLLQCAQEAQSVKAFVYTSSSSIVHDNYTDIVRGTEELPYCLLPEQKEYYSHSKALAEKLVLESNGKGGVLTTSIRAATMFGEGDSLMMPIIVQNSKAGRLNYQIGDGTNLFDFTYTGNVAYAHILAIKALLRECEKTPPQELKVSGEAFFITNDDPMPFWEVTRGLVAAAGYPVTKTTVIPTALYSGIAHMAQWVIGTVTLGTKQSPIDPKTVRYLTMTRTFDISKAKTRLGYRPLVSMKDGMQKAGDWYKLQHDR